MEENSIRRAVESLNNDSNHKELDILYWYYHSDIPELKKREEIGKKVGYSGSSVYLRLKTIRGKFEANGISSIDDPQLRLTIKQIVDEVRNPQYNSDATEGLHEVSQPPPEIPPDEPPIDQPPPESPVPPSGGDNTGPEINWRSLFTRRRAIFLAPAMVVLVGVMILFLINPLTGRPINPPEEEESLPTIDNREQETQIAQNVNATNTAIAPTAWFDQTRNAQIAVDTSVALTVEAGATETAEAMPTNTPTNVPTVTPTLTPSLTPSPSPTPTTSPPELLFMDDFEDVKADTYPSSTGWRNIYDGITAYVTTETSCEGNKSFRLDGKQNWGRSDIINIPAYDYVSYELCVRIEKPNNKARVGFNNPNISEWGTYYADVFFSDEGFIVADGQNLMRYVVGQWHHISVVADFVSEKMNVYIDGELKGVNLSTGPKDYTTFQLTSGNNFHTISYFDNLRIYNLHEPPNLENRNLVFP